MASEPEPQPLSLRQRRRKQTRHTIEVAALRLADRQGVKNVTVAEIAEASEISVRTFFNYFPSKETAILGDESRLDQAAVESFLVNGGTLAEALFQLLVQSVESSTVRGEVIDLRRMVLDREPAVSAQVWARSRTLESHLAELIHERQPRAPSVEPDLSARLCAFITVAALREAWNSWTSNQRLQAFEDHLKRSFDAIPHVIELLAENPSAAD